MIWPHSGVGTHRSRGVIGDRQMKKPVLNVTNLITAAGMVFAGYVLITSLPDLYRYIRISTM